MAFGQVGPGERFLALRASIVFIRLILRYTIVTRYYGFTVICVSVCPCAIHPCVFSFQNDNFSNWMITSVNINRFSPNLVCALILWILR